jgi:hypothetical protein
MSPRSPEELAALAASGAPVLYSPEEAEMILPGKTAYWLKNQARLRRIPCTRLGRTVLFTPADLNEIARDGARKPATEPAGVVPISGGRKKAPVAGRKLQARVPRKNRGAA